MCGAVAGILIALGGILRGFVGGCRTFLCRGKGRLSSIQHNLCIGYFLLPLRLCTFGSSNRLVLQGIQCILGRIPLLPRFFNRIFTVLPCFLCIGIGSFQLLLGLLERKTICFVRIGELHGRDFQLFYLGLFGCQCLLQGDLIKSGNGISF